MSRTIMCIVGTRPELIKMSRVINKFQTYTKFIIVHTGQNYDYELNQVFFDDLGIRKPDYFLDSARETPSKTIASVIEKTDEIFDKCTPDAVLLYGDTNSCLSVISAKRRKIQRSQKGRKRVISAWKMSYYYQESDILGCRRSI